MQSPPIDVRAWCIRASGAVYGLAVGAALAPQLVMRSSPQELPGVVQATGVSPSTPLLQLVVAIALAVAGAFAAHAAAKSLVTIEARWPAVAFCAALASAPVTLMHFGTLRHVILLGLIAIAIVPLRRLQPRFSRADVVLIPTLMSMYFAFLDTGFGRTPAATFLRASVAVFVLRLIVGLLATNRNPGLAFAAAPLALLFQMQWMSARMSGVISVVWLIATSLVVAWLMRSGIAEGAVRRFATFIAYPILVAAYALALLGISAPPAIDFFEDGHDLLPASAMARGELPYRDVVPVHGLLSDGGLDLLAMKSGVSSIGTLLKIRRVEASLNLMAIYAVAVAATGSAEVGLLAVFLGVALWPSSTLMVRVIPSLAALALLVASVRLRSRRYLFAAGATIAIAVLFSLDFALYSAAVAIVAVVRWSGDRRRAALSLAGGLAAVAVPLLVVFAVIGFARDFLTMSATLVRTGGVHVRSLFVLPDALRSPGAVAVSFAQPESFAAIVWIVALIVAATAVAASPLRNRRRDAIAYVAIWIVAAAVSYAERQHLYFEFALAGFLVAMLFRFRSSKVRPAAITVAILIALIARPFAHVFDVATPLRRSGGSQIPGWIELTEIPRARGALIEPGTGAAVRSVRSFVTASLRPGETFYDFANASLLYYLLDRRSPVRYPVITFCETAAAQHEVIEALERDRRVRAVLIAFPGGFDAIDGVPNRVRAPLVWSYLQKNFRPSFDQNGVVFWTR